MKNFKTVPNHTSKLHFPWETINYPDSLTNFLENGGLVGDSQFRLTPKTDKVSQITTSVVVDSYHVSKHGQVSTLDSGFVDIQKQKSTDNIIPFFVTNSLDNNIDNSPFFTANIGLKKSTLFNHNDSELEQYQPIHAVVSSNLGNHVESTADTVISRTIVEVSKNPETQLDETKVKDNLKVIFADTLQNNSELDLLDIYGIVDQALRDSYDYLSKFRFDPEYSQKLETAFGTDFNREVADKLFNSFADRNFTNIPTIKIVNRGAIAGGNGAFSDNTQKVYLAVEFINKYASNTARITDVLIEEIGHFVDSQINEIDATGDEGDIFSELVLGNTLSDEALKALKAENDKVTVVRGNNEEIGIEENTDNIRVGTWNILRNEGTNTPGITENTHIGRIKKIAEIGCDSNIDIICIQEFNSSILLNLSGTNRTLATKLGVDNALDKLDGLIDQKIAGYNFKFVIPEIPFDPYNNQTYKDNAFSVTDGYADKSGYLVLYNNNITNVSSTGSTLSYSSSPTFYQSLDQWKVKTVIGGTSGTDYLAADADKLFRPPITFTATKGSKTYNFFTWHNEYMKSGSQLPNTYKTTLPRTTFSYFDTLLKNDTKTNSIILGDFNIGQQSKNLLWDIQQNTTGETRNRFIGYKGWQENNDIVMTNAQNAVIKPFTNLTYQNKTIKWTDLQSDSHYPIFAEIQFSGGQNNTPIEEYTYVTKNRKRLKLTKTITPLPLQLSLDNPENLQNINLEQSTDDQDWFISYDYDGISQPLLFVDDGNIDFLNANGQSLLGSDGKLTGDAGNINKIKITKISPTSKKAPVIYASVGNNQASALFTGEIELDANNLEASISELGNDSDPDFEIGGFEVTFTDLAIVDDHLELQGKVKLPEQLGGLEVSVEVDEKQGTNNKIIIGYPGEEVKVNESQTITIGDYGIAVTGGSLKLPGTRKFNALGLIEIQTKDAALDFNFQESEATITGEFIVPSLKDATLNLKDGNYIKVKKVNDALQFAMTADFSVSDINIYGDWKLTNIKVSVNKTYGQSITDVKVIGSTTLHYGLNKTAGLEVSFADGRLKNLTGSNINFDFFGTNVNLNKIEYTPDRNLTDTILWDPELKAQGSIILPQALGNATVDITGSNYLVVNNDGIDLTGLRFTIPNFDKNLLGLGKLRAIGTNITLEYAKVLDKDGKTVLEKYFKIQGKLVLPNFYNLTADFSGSNYIKISNNSVNPVEVVGTFSASNIDIAPGWKIKYAELGIDTTNKRVTARGTLIIPSNIEIGADVIFDSGVLTYADIKADRLNKPIGTTGAFLQSIEGQYKGGNTSAFTGKVGITAGAQINLNLPSWAGGNKRGSLVELNASATITSSNLTANGDITVLGGLMRGTANAEVNWDKGYLWASSYFNILDGLITTKTQFLATSNLNLYMFGEANVNIPSFVPFIGGTNLGSGEVYVEYTNDNNLSNDYVAAWGIAFKGTWLESTIGIKVCFDGKWQVIHSQEARTIGQYATTKIKTLHDSLNAPAEKEPQHQIGDTIRDTPIISGKNIAGTDGNDTLHGENTPDTIYGKKGNDLLFGEGGNDTLSGDDGHDMVYGGTGNDDLYGDGDNDLLFGDDGHDRLFGGIGNDLLYGDGGTQTQVLRLDGVDDYVSVVHSTSLNISQQITIEAWVKLANSALDQKIIGKTPVGSGYLLGVGNGKLYPEFWDCQGNRNAFQEGQIASNQWTHIAVTWKQGENMIGYINGIEVGKTRASSNPLGTNNRNLRMGVAPWDLNAFKVNGAIDEVRIWNVARSATDISNNLKKSLLGTEAGLVGYWNIDNATGNTIKDLTAYGNAGTVFGQGNNLDTETVEIIIIGGNDILDGGAGNDTLNGGEGYDRVITSQAMAMKEQIP